MKFDYEAVASSIATIETAIASINEAIEDKITNTTYISGNAKDAVDAYIASLNKCLDPIVPEITQIRDKISEVKSAYLSAETGIRSAFNGPSAGGSSRPTDSNFSTITK